MTAQGQRRALDWKTAKSLPFPLLRAQFVRFYGAEWYLNSRWPTRDGVIPWTLFYHDLAQMYRVLAMERLHLSDAISLAGAGLMGGKEGVGKVQAARRKLERTAYPWES